MKKKFHMEGIIKEFNRKRGYGYIDYNGTPLYFTCRDTLKSERDFIKEGTKVMFSTFPVEDGIQAENVRII